MPAQSQPPLQEGAGSFRPADVPRWVAERLTRLAHSALDRVFDEPLDVPSAAEALEMIQSRRESSWTPALSGVAEWTALRMARGKLGSRVGRRLAGSAGSKMVGRAAIPVTVTLDIARAARDGTHELQVLASYLIARLRQAELPIERDVVRRVTTSIYLRPDARPDLQRSSGQLFAAVARRWATGAVPGLRGRRRHHARRRIRAIERLDLRQLSAGASSPRGSSDRPGGSSSRQR